MKISLLDFFKIPKEQYNGIYDVEDYGTFYYLNGKNHREDGPAVHYIGGAKSWFINGYLHRLDGPAIKWNDGTQFYYIEGKQYSKDEFDKIAYLHLNKLQDYL